MPNTLHPDAIRRRKGGKDTGKKQCVRKPYCLFSHVPHASKIMRHLAYKSSSFAKTSVPIHSEKSASGLKEVTLPFSTVSFDILRCFIKKSREYHVMMAVGQANRL